MQELQLKCMHANVDCNLNNAASLYPQHDVYLLVSVLYMQAITSILHDHIYQGVGLIFVLV